MSMEEREVIGQMYWQGRSLSEIAEAIGRHKGTVSRELSRNGSTKYKCYTPMSGAKENRRKEERGK